MRDFYDLKFPFIFIYICLLAIKSSIAFSHPGLLHTEADFRRIRANVQAKRLPWLTGWNKLISSPYASVTYRPNPSPVVYRGSDGIHPENYGQLYQDIAAAYALAIRWKVTQDIKYGRASINILDAWSFTLTGLSGSSDQFLSAGIYGYQFAQVGEIMRGLLGWKNFGRFCSMMINVFYSKVNEWFTQHAAGRYAPYALGVYAGWDLCNMAAAVAIGILTDNHQIYSQGANYFLTGATNGGQTKAIPYLHWVDNQVLAQIQESGRDQGHNMLDIGLLSVIGLMAFNQGNDLLSYNNSIILAASEYTARYNLGVNVPYRPYSNGPINLPMISSIARGDVRPIWELIYNHYGVLKKMDVRWTKRYRDMVVSKNQGAEGGGGNYGPNSGGYDQLGWGTLLYTL